MIIRELLDGRVLVISQEAHADVAAQFAAHWGNDRFARLDPYQSTVFGTTYHDSGQREVEATLPVDVERGLPYNFRGVPPEVRNRDADTLLNAQWIRQRDPYASLLVTIHHTGLRKYRYNTVRSHYADGKNRAAPGADSAALGMDSAFEDLEGWQREVAEQLGMTDEQVRRAFWQNYQCLQVFDLLSLHLCCDGYAGDRLRDMTLECVPVAAGAAQTVDVHLQPTGPSSLRMDPYPFDAPTLAVTTMALCMAPQPDASEAAVKEAYYKAPRTPVTWEITG